MNLILIDIRIHSLKTPAYNLLGSINGVFIRAYQYHIPVCTYKHPNRTAYQTAYRYIYVKPRYARVNTP